MSRFNFDLSTGVDRTRKVASVVHRELSEIIIKDLADPRINSITITSIVVSKDLRHAKAFVTSRLTGDSLQSGIEALNHAAAYIRRQLGSRLSMKYTPSIRFLEDKSIAQGARVSTLIENVVKSESDKT